MTAAATGGSYGALRHNVPFLRVFGAGLGSMAGSAVAGVCIVWLVYARTGSALDLAFVGSAWLLAALGFSLLGGAWADRYHRARLMVAADLVRAGAIAVLVADLTFRGFDLLVVAGAWATVGACQTVFNPAEHALLPAIVPAESVVLANGLVSAGQSIVSLVGTALGGVLILTAGATVGIAVNAATFLGSALLLSGIRLPARTVGADAAPPNFLSEIVAGFRWLYGSVGLFQLTISAMFFNFCSTLVLGFLVIYATGVLHGSALVFAALLVANVAGLALGSMAVGRVGAVRYAGKAWVIPYGIGGALATLLLAGVPIPPIAIGAMFFTGFVGGFSGTAWLSAAQLLVPTEMQGRYFGVDNLGSIAIIPVSQIGGALLIGVWGVRTTFLWVGIVYLAFGMLFLLPRPLRELGYPPRPGPVPGRLAARSDVAGAATER